MGLVGVSEGAIPFAASDPLSVIPANMIGSSVACIMAFIFGITDNVAHGGPIVVLLGTVNKPLLALTCMITGSIVVISTVALSLKAINLKRKFQVELSRLLKFTCYFVLSSIQYGWLAH